MLYLIQHSRHSVQPETSNTCHKSIHKYYHKTKFKSCITKYCTFCFLQIINTLPHTTVRSCALYSYTHNFLDLCTQHLVFHFFTHIKEYIICILSSTINHDTGGYTVCNQSQNWFLVQYLSCSYHGCGTGNDRAQDMLHVTYFPIAFPTSWCIYED